MRFQRCSLLEEGGGCSCSSGGRFPGAGESHVLDPSSGREVDTLRCRRNEAPKLKRPSAGREHRLQLCEWRPEMAWNAGNAPEISIITKPFGLLKTSDWTTPQYCHGLYCTRPAYTKIQDRANYGQLWSIQSSSRDMPTYAKHHPTHQQQSPRPWVSFWRAPSSGTGIQFSQEGITHRRHGRGSF